MATFQFEKTLKAGDILTSVTILVSVVALVLSFAKDRATRVAEQATKVRVAAATTLSRLDRWQAVQQSLYAELQPTFVELSEDLSRQFEVYPVRDRFWKEVTLARSKVARRVLDEQLGAAYTDLIAHFPAARERHVKLMTELASVEIASSDRFMGDAEQRILALEGKRATYQTAHLGNALRDAAARASSDLQVSSERLITPMRAYLVDVISLRDEEIISASRTR